MIGHDKLDLWLRGRHLLHSRLLPRAYADNFGLRDIDRRHRATYLSLQSLAGRLIYAVVLLGLSALSTNAVKADWSSFRSMMLASALFGVTGFIVLWRNRGVIEPSP